MNLIKEFVQGLINTFLHNPNQFASGGLLLMAIGSIGALLRKIPYKIWEWIIHQTTVTLTVTDDQRAYHWIKAWIEDQRIMKRVRHMDIFNRGNSKYVLLPAPGHHWMLYRGRILSVVITRTEEAKMMMIARKETMTFSTIGRKQDLYKQLMQEAHSKAVKQEEKRPELHAWGSWGEWLQIHSYSPRPLDSVILPLKDKQLIINDIEEFRKNQTWYTRMGIPYRKAYLFYGPPGTGKTSLVTGLSSRFNANVYILKLSDMSDTSLREAITQTEPNSFLVIEDIDCINASLDRKKTKDSKEKTGVTLSGLLNVVDGMLSPSGAVFIMTTNHREKLDPALLRPGRTDIQLHVTYAIPEQKQELYNRFFPGECPKEYLDVKEMTMAELQQLLMEKKVQNSS